MARSKGEGEPLDGEATPIGPYLSRLSELANAAFLATRGAFRREGPPVEITFDELRAWRGLLDTLNAAEVTTRIADVRLRLLTLGLTSEVRRRVAEVCPPLALVEKDPKTVYLDRAADAVKALPGFRMGGAGFYAQLFTDRRKASLPTVTFASYSQLCELERRVALACDDKGSKEQPSYADCVPLIFFCLEGGLDMTCRLIDAQLHSAAESHFFEELRRFLRVYGDVSIYLLNNTPDNEALYQRMRKGLQQILSHAGLYVPPRQGRSEVNLFDLLEGMFKEDAVSQSPWFRGDLTDTPFDPEKVWSLITPEVPREALARLLLELNDYHFRSAVRAVDRFLHDYDHAKGQGKKRDAVCTGLMHRMDLFADTDLSLPIEIKVRRLKQLFHELPVELHALFTRYPCLGEGRVGDLSGEDLKRCEAEVNQFISSYQLPISLSKCFDERIRHLRRYDVLGPEGDPLLLNLEIEGSQRAVSLRPLLLRVIDPQRVVKSPEAQREFQYLIDTLRRVAIENDPLFARSLQFVLSQDDSALELPLDVLRDRSLRRVLTELLLDGCDPATIRKGTATDPRPLLPVPHSEHLVGAGDLSKDFNTAAGGVRDTLLLEAGAVLERLFPFHGALERVVRFVNQESIDYFEASDGERPTHEFFPYLTATQAWQDFVRQCLRFTPHDNIVVTNQEYDKITEAVECPVRVVYLNRRGEQRSLTADELFTTFDALIDEHTRMVIISTKTRFGDTPCLAPSTDSRKLRHLSSFADLIARLKAKHPHVLMVLDGCQALARGPADRLSRLRPDVYLTSGVKALGVEAGLIGISNSLRGSGGVASTFRYDPSWVPLDRFAAFGLGLAMLRDRVDGFRLEGNFDTFRSHPLDRKIGWGMSELTHHAIKRVDGYGQEFCERHLPRVASWMLDQHDTNRLHQQFGCAVYYPVHRDRDAFCGILTVHFPNVSGRSLVRGASGVAGLEAKGYKLLPCLEEDRGMRISFRYGHTPTQIDQLFMDIQQVHAALLQRQVADHATDPLKYTIRNRIGWQRD